MIANRWRVWPRPAWLLSPFVLHGLLWGGILLLLSRGRGFTWKEICDILDAAPINVLIPGAVAYAVYRVWAFHPILRPDYRNWMANTHWRHDQPLPFGPVHLVPQDAIVLALAVAASLPFQRLGATAIVRTFVVVYLLMLMSVLLMTFEWPSAYAMAFGMGGLILTESVVWLFFSVAALTYLIGVVGLRRSYRRFPWSFDLAKWSGELRQRQALDLATRRPEYGWPFELLGPSGGDLGLPVRHGVAISLVIGWWFFTSLQSATISLAAVGKSVNLDHVFFPAFFAVLAVIGRLLTYRCLEYLPPISLVGRLATGRWVIPGYDQVFLAPLLSLTSALFLPPLLVRLGVSWPAANALGATGAALAILTLPPGRKRWLLTGDHRVIPTPFGLKPPNLI